MDVSLSNSSMSISFLTPTPSPLPNTLKELFPTLFDSTSHSIKSQFADVSEYITRVGNPIPQLYFPCIIVLQLTLPDQLTVLFSTRERCVQIFNANITNLSGLRSSTSPIRSILLSWNEILSLVFRASHMFQLLEDGIDTPGIMKFI